MSNTFSSLMARLSDAILAVPTLAELPTDAIEGAIRYVQADDELYTFDGTTWQIAGGGVSGPGPGPATSTDNAVVRWDGTTGDAVQNSGVLIDNSDNITTPGDIQASTIVASVFQNSSYGGGYALESTGTTLSESATTSNELGYLSGVTSGIQTQLNDKVDDAEVGAPNGVASLDGGGKVPASQLPNSIMDYLGNWSAATNTPTLADGTGNAGDVYQNTAVGTVNFGSGNITFAIGDFAIYSGAIWQKSINSNAVTSVNSLTGIVTAGTVGDTSGGSSTVGSLLFVGAGQTIAQDNAGLFWDDTNDRLGIGTATPSNTLTVSNPSATLTGAFFTNTNVTGTGRLALFTNTGLGRGVEVSMANAASVGAAIRVDATHAGEALRMSATAGRLILGTTSSTSTGVSITSSSTTSTNPAIFGSVAGTASATQAAIRGDVTGSGIGAGLLGLRNSTGVSLLVGTSAGAGVGISPQFAMASGDNYNLQLPLTQGAASTLLQNDGTGILSWVGAPSGSIGGSITGATAGSVLFAGTAGVLQQDNAQFFWDDTNNRLGLGTATPGSKLDVTGTADIEQLSIRANATQNLYLAQFYNTSNLGVLAIGAAGGIERPAAVAGDLVITNLGANSVLIGTNGTEKVRVESGGNVGIGTTGPLARLDVERTTAGVGLRVGGTSTGIRMRLDGSTSGELGITVPAAVTTHTLTLPAVQGAANTTLKNDGAGALSWSAVDLGTSAITGTLPIANGGTGASSAQAAINALAGAVTDNRVLRGDGTNVVLGQIDDPAFFTSGANATSTLPGLIPTYAKGDFDPTVIDAGGAGDISVGPTNAFARYTKIGSLCYVEFSTSLTTITGTISLSGTLPFAAKNTARRAMMAAENSAQVNARVDTVAGSTTINFFPGISGGSWAVGAHILRPSFSYEVDE
jgi:hypothetical protein